MSVSPKSKENESIVNNIESLLKISRESSSDFWRDIARRMTSGRRRYASINLYKIDMLTKEGDIVLVPGTILSVGELTKNITVSSFRISKKAMEKIVKAGAKFKSLSELSSENPKGTNIKILR